MREKTDLNLLRILIALHDSQSVSEVARSLKISQPSVSLALGKLREVFKDPLFVKTTTGMKPTLTTIRLVDPIRESLRKIDDEIVRSVPFDPVAYKSTFTFGMSDIGESLLLPKLVEQVGKRAPNAKTRTVALPMAELEQGLETGEVDLVLGYRPDMKRTHYYQQKLFTAGHVCIARADHPVKGSHLTEQQFLDLEHILICANNRAQEELEHFLNERSVHRKIRHYTPHVLAVPLLVSQSNLIATMPHFLADHMAKRYQNLKIMVPDIALPVIDVKQYWHRRFHNDPMNKWLRTLVAELFQTGADEVSIDHGQPHHRLELVQS